MALLLAALAVGAGFLLFSSEETAIQALIPLPKAFGQASPVKLRLSNGQGVRRVRAWFEQNGSRYELFDQQFSGSWKDWVAKGRQPVPVEFPVGKDRAPGLVPGQAKLVIQAEANNLRGLETRLTQEARVMRGRPEIHAGKDRVFLRRGGTGIVAFRTGGEWSEAGVKVGRHEFPGFAVKSDPSRQVVMFAYPPDVDVATSPLAFARNLAGDEVTAPFRHRVTRLQFREREVRIGDAFLNRVVSQVDPSGNGELWQRFAKINSETRLVIRFFVRTLTTAELRPDLLI